MRFIENGPSIPDELLIARDQGRVVFFCGAGVSRAKAGLPDFFGLAERVTQRLGVADESSALKILNEARDIESRTKVAGLISADKIFGLLERDFLGRDIEAAVASALKPDVPSDVSAHKILIDLATTREGRVRLVTTNFDRLFNDCGIDLPSWKPPFLPDPLRDMHGIVYLHGRATADYSGAEEDGFVLTSSEFGRAYLSDGWATSFFRQILRKYVIVFVGYTADDPPVHYLLEALNKSAGGLENVYAFQSGSVEEAVSRWLHKGVEAIPYSPDDNHIALWKTLEAWAERASNPDHWYSEIIKKATDGPEKLLPHERGQVAHIVSTTDGVRKLLDADTPPPAEWLCVFDPLIRYSKPGYTGDFQDRGDYADPFDAYCIDSDISPKKIGPEDRSARREIPPGVWSAFSLNRFDKVDLVDENLSSLRGHWSFNVPHLPSRLEQMGLWISRVADQNAAVWWAARQDRIHPIVQDRIRRQLERTEKSSTLEVRRAWRYLFESWEYGQGGSHRDWYGLAAEIAKDGWSQSAVRRYASLSRPGLKVEHNIWGGPKPPVAIEQASISQLMRLDVAYPDLAPDIDIPDEWVSPIAAELRKNLEIALDLETELGGYGFSSIAPIIPDDNAGDDQYSRTHGISGAVIAFSGIFERLININPEAARDAFSKWTSDDDTIFAQLRIWAASKPDVVSDDKFGAVIATVSDEAFWYERHARDLLFTLSSRWASLDIGTRSQIESRLLSGPPRWEQEDDSSFGERRAWRIINRINWLARHGCELQFDIEAETTRLRASVPGWKPEYAEKAAESLEGRSGWVKTDTEYSALLAEPLASTLTRARELSGRQDDFLIERAPFAGLSVGRPVRAFSALRVAAKNNDFPEWAWSAFLNSEARKNDKPKFSAFIAEQIVRYSDAEITIIIRPATTWIASVSKVIAAQYPSTFNKVVKALTGSLGREPQGGLSSVLRGSKDPDWAMEALNSPTGNMARALFDDPRTNSLKSGEGFPSDWLDHADSLIGLDGDLGRYAIVIFAHHLNWFYSIDPHWTEKALIRAIDSKEPDDIAAFWAGFFWGARTPNQKLYMRLKPYLLKLAKESGLARREHGEVLSGVILAGWGSFVEETGLRCVTNDEFRDVLVHADDEFRSRVLWQAGQWAAQKSNDVENKWAPQVVELLKNVWPRQKSAKSPLISTRLCDLAFSNEEWFLELAEAVLPLLTKTDRDHLMLPNLRRSKDNIVDVHPHQTLALLHAALPDNVSAWPYGIEDVLGRIEEADSTLKADERLIELKRKWNAR